jgi:hypothetical protein
MTDTMYRDFVTHLGGCWLSAAAAVCASSLLLIAGCSGEEGGDDEGGADAGGDTGPTIVEACGAGTRPTNPGMDAGGNPGDAHDVGAPGDVSMVDATGMDVGDTSATGDATSAPDAGMEGYEPLPESFSYASEYSMRFTDFQFAESSTGASVNFAITNFLEQQKEYPIVVLMHFRDFDLQAETVELRGGAGVKVDKECNPTDRPSGECNYDWDPNTPERYRQIQIDAETGELDGGLESLKFVARTEIDGEVKVTNITIRDLVFTDAALRPDDSGDGVAIDRGVLEGYITYEDASNAKVKLPGGVGIPVSDLLKRGQLNYDSDGDGELDAWCLEGTFSADETNIVE